jgi:hypothetical protein
LVDRGDRLSGLCKYYTLRRACPASWLKDGKYDGTVHSENFSSSRLGDGQCLLSLAFVYGHSLEIGIRHTYAIYVPAYIQPSTLIIRGRPVRQSQSVPPVGHTSLVLPPMNDHGSLAIGSDVAEYNSAGRPLGVGFEFVVIE